MREPRSIPGREVSLFDRLVDREPAARFEAEPLRIHDRKALRESVRRDLAKLLNTRAPRWGMAGDMAAGTVLDFGLPDFSALAAANSVDRLALGETVAKKIRMFETRLVDPRVVLEPDPSNPKSLIGLIRGQLRVGSVLEPVSFPFSLDPLASEMEVFSVAS